MKGIHHVTMAVRDLERAIDFYLGSPTLELVDRGESRAMLGAPNAYLELVEEPGVDVSMMPVEGPGITHVCFQSPATNGLFAAMADRGAGRVTRGEAVDLGGYGVRYGYARDPDGLMFEVEELDDPHFPGPVWLAHVALVSPDLDRLVDFYRAVLRTEPYRREEDLHSRRLDAVAGIDDVRIRAAWFRVGNMVLELWQYRNPATPTARDHVSDERAGYRGFTFEVADLDAAVAHLETLDVEVSVDAESGRANTHDPDGNAFGLLATAATGERSLDHLPAIEAHAPR